MKSFKRFLLESEHQNGTYCCLTVSKECGEKLIEFCRQLGIQSNIGKRDFHCSIVFSSVPCFDIKEISWPLPITSTATEFKILGEGNDAALVLVLNCKEAENIHELAKQKYGAVHSHPDYIAHVTIAYDYTGHIPPKSKIPTFPIVFDGFTIRGLEP